jgi:methionyl-tRNA synthetase
MAKKFYVTTPIYYVNDVPHIGHTCTTVAADIIARYYKLLGKDVFFLTGTDEHGAKVAEAAKEKGLSPQKFCDQVSKNFKEIWPKLNIEYDYFIRTTNPEHEKIAQEIIKKIYKNGDIYKGKYEGFYCVGCEKFVTETDLINGRCPLHPNRKIEKQSEENYFFKLSKYVPQLIKAIEDPKNKYHYQISPQSKREEVLSKLKAGVDDLSISRANVPWGIPIPWDKSQTIYVWVEALINYFSALKINKNEEFWPANLHFLAKDILWFHAVIWEAMLISAKIPPPKEIFVHSFYLIDGKKMSKSLGNVISPQELLKKFGADGTRYLIASSFPYDSDSDVGWERFTEKYNADLANGLGNLVARVAKLAEQAKLKTQNSKLKTTIENSKFKNYHRSLEKYQFNEALSFVWEKISQADKYIDTNQPWTLKGKKLEKVLGPVIIEIQEIASLIKPFLPETAEKIEKQFKGPKIKSEKPLFPRISS